jgi:hypothetical protein
VNLADLERPNLAELERPNLAELERPNRHGGSRRTSALGREPSCRTSPIDSPVIWSRGHALCRLGAIGSATLL